MSDKPSSQPVHSWAQPPQGHVENPRPLPEFLRPVEPRVSDDYPEPPLAGDLDDPTDRPKAHAGPFRPHLFSDVLDQFPDPPSWVRRSVIIEWIEWVLDWIFPSWIIEPLAEFIFNFLVLFSAMLLFLVALYLLSLFLPS